MDDRTYEQFDYPEEDLSVRGLFVKDLLVEIEDEEPFLDDTIIWFAAKYGDDFWWACGLSDDLTLPDEMLEEMDLEHTRKLAIYLGETWDSIKMDCPHCVANRHRLSKLHMPSIIMDDVLESDDERLAELRDRGRFAAMADFTEQISGGMKLSLN